MSNAEKFLTTFNQLEKELHRLRGATEHLGFKRLVDTLSQSNSLVDLHKIDLIEFVELRNAIVHRSTGLPIAEPHDDVVAKMSHIYELFAHPPTALDIAAQPVYTCRTDEPIARLVKTMHQEFYTNIPVYNDGTFVGVFSEHTLVAWLAGRANDETFRLEETTVGELHAYFDQESDKHNGYKFVSQDTSAFAVREAFTTFLSEKKKLEAVLVTQTGNPQEHIKGIITAWDLPKIMHSLGDEHSNQESNHHAR